MIINKIPVGTKIYLKKNNSQTLYILPGKTIVNDSLYVAYDVKMNDQVVIPKGTRVIGNWVTESVPSIAAQLQVKKIYLQSDGQKFKADSDVITTVTTYNSKEIDNSCYLYKIKNHKSTTNLNRRIVKFGFDSKPLLDNNHDRIYLKICTTEIPVTLTKDFIPFPIL